ncbi:MAG TPA: hypothetical protein VF081_07785 [Solirubrobacterales bacterium]
MVNDYRRVTGGARLGQIDDYVAHAITAAREHGACIHLRHRVKSMNALRAIRHRTGHFLGGAWRLTKAHYGWILGVLSLLIGVVGLYVALNPERPFTQEEQRLVDSVPPKVGWHCRSYPGGFSPSIAPLVSAAVECDPVDPGPEFLSFRLYTSSGDMNLYMQKLSEETRREGVSCAEHYRTAAQWVDASGKVRGELICKDYSDYAHLYWSDEHSSIVGAASVKASNEQALHVWWQRAVKLSDGPPQHRARKHLTALLPPDFGRCQPFDVIQPPMALASVGCDPGGGVTYAGGSLFPTQKLLDDYIRENAAGYPGVSHDGCDESTFSFTPYGPADNEKLTHGRLLCYVRDGVQWFEWTVNRYRLYAYAARADESWSKLYPAWSHSLSFAHRGAQ